LRDLEAASGRLEIRPEDRFFFGVRPAIKEK
jgi:hypothetical protein